MIEQREKLYDNIRSNCDVTTDNGVQLEINLNQTQLITLKLATENYILKTLESYYERKFKRKNFLVESRDDILNLPNRTPNGAFYPKVENIEEYNIIQSVVNDILDENGLINQLSSYDVCTVRVVDGVINELDNRMSSTTKLHSDAWSGHNGDAILTIGLLGDATTSLEFNRIIEVENSDSFFETQQDYASGLGMIEKYEKIKNLEFNNMTIFDHACLHKTIKDNGGLRVSIDFGITTKKSKGIDKKNPLDKNVVHKDIKEVLEIGHTKKLTATETLKECYERIKNDNYESVPKAHVSDNIEWI